MATDSRGPWDGEWRRFVFATEAVESVGRGSGGDFPSQGSPEGRRKEVGEKFFRNGLQRAFEGWVDGGIFLRKGLARGIGAIVQEA